MNNPMTRNESSNSDTASLPAAKRARAGRGRPARIVRRLAAVPSSFYGWVSGPPMTKLERERAALVAVTNFRRSGNLLA